MYFHLEAESYYAAYLLIVQQTPPCHILLSGRVCLRHLGDGGGNRWPFLSYNDRSLFYSSQHGRSLARCVVEAGEARLTLTLQTRANFTADYMVGTAMPS